MFIDVRDLKTGDLFVFEVTYRPGINGIYHFRFLQRTSTDLDKIIFKAVLEKIVKEDMPVFREKLNSNYIETFTATIRTDGLWPVFTLLERGKKDVDYCQTCATPLQWASLALRCPKCWRVY